MSPSGVEDGARHPRWRGRASPLLRFPSAAVLLLLLGGCALVSRPAPPMPAAGGVVRAGPAGGSGAGPTSPTGAPAPEIVAGWTEEGVASWYGRPFHGRQTASGEIYDMDAATAAHPFLPFGTVIRVENLVSGASTTLRINDRGPFVGGRVLDVSRRGARELELLGPGTGPVRITVLEAPVPRRCWEVQVGAFRERGNAMAALSRLEDRRIRARIQEEGDGVFRVVAGPWNEHPPAAAFAGREGGVLLGC